MSRKVDRRTPRGGGGRRPRYVACALDPVELAWRRYDGAASQRVAAPDHEAVDGVAVPAVLFYRRRDALLTRRTTGPQIQRFDRPSDWVPRKKSHATIKRSHAAAPLEQNTLLNDRMTRLQNKSRQSKTCAVM